MTSPLISIENLSKTFGNRQILDGFSLKIARGERVAVIGPSGCGKSTLLRLILGLHHPDSGRVLYEGNVVSDMTPKALRNMRLKIGMLFQSGALFDSMTVGENVAFSLVENLGWTGAQVSNRVKEVLALVEMSGFEELMPDKLSGGQRKRIGLARAIAPEPEILMYDEPTTGLDPILSTNIEDLIVKTSQRLRITSIVVSHQRSTILRTADKIYMMHEGKALPAESPSEIDRSQNKIVRYFMSGGLENS